MLNVSALPDRVQNQASALKATFDQAGVDIKAALNALIVELEDATSANNIGADVGSVATKTVQAILTAFETEIADRYTKTETETLVANDTNSLVADVDVNLTTGIITVTKKDGTVETFDTALEKVPAKFEVVENGGSFVLKITNMDGTVTQADITQFMNVYNFGNSGEVAFDVVGTGNEKTVTATIRSNSIGLDKLSLTAVSTLEGYVNNAKDSATAAKTSETNARTSEINAQNAATTAQNAATTATNAATTATTKANEAAKSADDAEYWAKQAQAGGGGGGITEIPVATADTLGGIKVGEGLDITEDGVLSAIGGGESGGVTKEYVDNAVLSGSGLSSNPIGTIIPFMGVTAPKGYLVCDGSEKNIADYSDLARLFELQFGSKNHFGGDGSTTFALPDLRNEFLRGYHGDATEQLSGEIGVHQDATEHCMFVGTYSTKQIQLRLKNSTDVQAAEKRDSNISKDNTYFINTVGTAGSLGSAENNYAYTSRPTNVAVLYCIKYTVSMEGLEVDATPTEGSLNAVSSGGTKAYIDSKIAYGTEDLTAGTSELATGVVYFCYE